MNDRIVLMRTIKADDNIYQVWEIFEGLQDMFVKVVMEIVLAIHVISMNREAVLTGCCEPRSPLYELQGNS